MGVRFPSISSTTFIGPLPANANETILLTTPPLNISLDFSQIIIQWAGSITAGATVTGHQFRLRRGTTLAGALVFASTWVQAVTAANAGVFSGVYVDTPGAVAGQQYTLSLGQIGATGAGVFNDGCLLAFAL